MRDVPERASTCRYVSVLAACSNKRTAVSNLMQFVIVSPYKKLECHLLLQKKVNSLKPSGHYMYRQWSLYVPPVVTICTASGHYTYRQFNIKQFYIQPTQCIYVLCVDLRTNSDYYPIQY